MFNVRDYGAAGDGITNDTTAVNNAIAAALALPTGGAIYFPAGKYYLGSLITVSATVNISFFGDGDVSQVLMQSGSGCFKVNLSAQIMVEFTNFRIVANAAAVGIDVSGPAGNYHTSTMLYMAGMTLERGSSYFTKGVTMASTFNGVIDDCLFDGTSKAYGNKAVEITELSTNLLISNTNFNFFGYGLYCGVYQEGVNIVNCYFVDLTVGVYFKANSSVRNTWLSMVSSHIDSRSTNCIAVDVENASAVFIDSCLFIGEATYIVRFKRVFEGGICNSQIFGPSTYGIYLDGTYVAPYSGPYGSWGGGTLPSESLSLVANNFRGPTNPIYATADTVQIYANSNTRSDSSFGNTFLALNNTDSGTNNFIGDNIGITSTVTTSGGSATESFNVDISKAGLGKKPNGVAVCITSDSTVGAYYDWDDAGSTKTNAVIKLFKFDGSNLSAATYRYSLRVGP